MRLLPFILLALAGSLSAGEPIYPLWDGQESIADYAKRINLPPTHTLDLGNGVKMELVLVPAGKFIMGVQAPPPVDEEGLRIKIMTGQALLAVSGVALLVMLIVIVLPTIVKRQWPKNSLKWSLMFILAAGIAVLSGMHWRRSAQTLEKAEIEYQAGLTLYSTAVQSAAPAHPVTLTRPFYMGKFVVTEEQYQQVTGQTPSNFKVKDSPVVPVSWDDAQAFCKKLSMQTKETVRLPTEAEWEFACRAGTTTAYYSGNTDKDLDRVAWYRPESVANLQHALQFVYFSKYTVHPVGQKEPNAFGLYDMHGNVWQWCQDWYDVDYYGKSPIEDPQGSTNDGNGVSRGGSWNYNRNVCTSAYRHCSGRSVREYDFGFRVQIQSKISTAVEK